MDNKAIANVFNEMADILEIQDENIFRINALRKAALTIANLGVDLRDVVSFNPRELQKIPGIGQGLAEKIVELVQNGKCKEHEELKHSIPAGLLELLRLRTVGPKKVKVFYSKLGVKNIKDLKIAAEKGKVRELEGMGEKSEAEILKAIQEYGRFSPERHLLSEALQEAERLISYMKQCKDVKHIQYAGSLRRHEETVGDIDILVTVKDPNVSHKIVMDHFVAYDDVLNVLSQGDTKSNIILRSGIQVDLRVIADESFGAALHYFTGDKQHNIKIRDLAKRKGLKISEYGVFKGERMIGGHKEEEIFSSCGLPFIIPELRRNDGEIEYGLKNKKFPNFIELKDIKGDLHCHSNCSDGKNTIEEMAQAFVAMGYEYFAITDHSSVVGVARGMGKKDIREQWKEIDKVQKKLGKKIKIFKGAEVDILKNGDLDFTDEILKELDIVVIAPHLYSRLSSDEQTKRLIAAIENPYSKILAHPTARLINKRTPMEFDMEKIIDACVANNVALEINSHPLRLDLSDKYVKIAKGKGAKFVIDTDAHSSEQVGFIEYGVWVARRGWLEKEDVINTQNLKEFDKMLKRV